MLLVAAVVGCGGGTTTETVVKTVTAETPDKGADNKRPQDRCKKLASGTRIGVCRDREAGTVYRIVRRDDTLRLKDIEAKLVASRFEEAIEGEQASGTYFVARLQITNRTKMPADLDETAQVGLLLKDKQYSPESLLATDGFLGSLQPDVPTEGEVVFDVPPDAPTKMDAPQDNAVVAVLPFSEAQSPDDAPKSAGYILLAE